MKVTTTAAFSGLIETEIITGTTLSFVMELDIVLDGGVWYERFSIVDQPELSDGKNVEHISRRAAAMLVYKEDLGTAAENLFHKLMEEYLYESKEGKIIGHKQT